MILWCKFFLFLLKEDIFYSPDTAIELEITRWEKYVWLASIPTAPKNIYDVFLEPFLNPLSDDFDSFLSWRVRPAFYNYSFYFEMGSCQSIVWNIVLFLNIIAVIIDTTFRASALWFSLYVYWLERSRKDDFSFRDVYEQVVLLIFNNDLLLSELETNSSVTVNDSTSSAIIWKIV